MNAGALILSPWARLSLIALVGLTVFGASYGFAHGATKRANALADRYADSIDAPLRRMLMPPRGRLVLSVQLGAIVAITTLAVALRAPALMLLALLVLPAPKLVLRHMRNKRCAAIEAKLDGFALALANATRATPSIGRALQLLQSTLPTPLDREIDQVLRELRVGSSVEQALLNMSWRVQSTSLDALLSGVLIAGRIGGRLPDILETTASTLREMARLDGVLRSKTAQAKMQIWVLACLPPVLVVAFDKVTPGYFDVFTASPLGMVVLTVAVLFWLSAILLARKIMAVEL